MSTLVPSTRRRRAITAGLTAGVALLLVSRMSSLAAQKEQDIAEVSVALAQAREITKELSTGLQEMLSEELANGGFLGAVKVCSEQAQTITGNFNMALGASARRVSQRYRNPNDQPDEYESLVLSKWQRAHARMELPAESVEVVTARDGEKHLRYMKPIVVRPMCLTCHGAPDRIPAEVKNVLGERYPKDLATGYAAGDLRGAVSVRIPLSNE